MCIINLRSFSATLGAAQSSHRHPELRHAQRRKTLTLTFVRRCVSIKFKANLTLTLDESVKERTNRECFHSRAARCVIMSAASTVLTFTVSNTLTSLGRQVICWFGNNRKWKSQVSVLFLASSSLLWHDDDTMSYITHMLATSCDKAVSISWDVFGIEEKKNISAKLMWISLFHSLPFAWTFLGKSSKWASH